MNLDIDELKFSKIAEDKDFEYPINIRQVGTIHKGVKIYIEDYAYTYLYQYAESGGSQEKIAVLVGRALKHNDEIIVMISGAIGGKYSKEINSMESFTDEDWENIDSQMKKHFSGLQILGWMHSQPGYGTFLNSNDTNFHLEIFSEYFNLLYLIDPTEKVDAFFVRAKTGDELEEARGYFIYYEKNMSMQEFMVDNKIINLRLPADEYKELEGKEDVANAFRRQEKKRRESITSARKNTNLYATLSVVLFLICFVMVAGLIQNGDKIARLEKDLSTVSSLYRTLAEQITKSVSSPAFAGQDEEPVIIDPVGPANIPDDILWTDDDLEINLPPEDEPTVPPTAEANDSLPAVAAEPPIPDYYIVEAGDNLSYISVKFYGTNAMQNRIMEVNNIENADQIYSGRKIKLPQP